MHVLSLGSFRWIMVPDYFFGKNIVHLPTPRRSSEVIVPDALRSTDTAVAPHSPGSLLRYKRGLLSRVPRARMARHLDLCATAHAHVLRVI